MSAIDINTFFLEINSLLLFLRRLVELNTFLVLGKSLLMTLTFYLPFEVQDVFPTPIRFSESECQLIDAEVQTLLDKGAIKVVSHETEEILSNIFLRPKKSGEMRPIINGRHLD